MMDAKSSSLPPPRRFYLRKRPDWRRIGILNPGYGYSRVSYGLPLSDTEFLRPPSASLRRLAPKRTSVFWGATPLPVTTGVDLLHTWNDLPLTGDFVVSFELELPRYLRSPSAWQMDLGHRILASDRCRGILALTRRAERHARAKFLALGMPGIADKISTFLGGVDTSGVALPEKDRPWSGQASRPLRIAFLGTAGLRKGLLPLIRGLEAVTRRGLAVELVIVGAGEPYCYVYREHTDESFKALRAVISRTDWITDHGMVPQKEVYRLIADCDLFAYPSLDDAQGWGPIEAGLLRLPRLVTDIFALPDVVTHEQTGWIIPVDKTADDRWVGLGTSGSHLRQLLDAVESRIAAGVEQCIERIANAPDVLERWAAASYDQLTQMYDPIVAARQLTEIYDRAIDRR